MDDLALTNRLLRDLRKKKIPVSGRDIVARIPGMMDEDLYALMAQGILRPLTSAPEIGDHKFWITSGRLSAKALREKEIGRKEDSVSVVATLPFQQISPISGLKSLHAELCRLIIGAEEEISIINPFFDVEGRRKIIPYLQGAIHRHVTTRIISRPSEPGERTSQADIFIRPLVDRKANGVDVRFFRGGNSTVHAKLLIADTKLAYVGSANLTGRSLAYNLELGVIVGGPSVAIFKRLFEELWPLSIRTSYG